MTNNIRMDSTPSENSSKRQTIIAIAFLLIVTLAHFREPLMGKGVFYLCDLGGTYLPMHVENARLRAAGEIPLWNKHGLLGYPTQAETETSGVYPPTLIFNLVEDCGIAYTLFIIFHFLVAAIGMMYLLRLLGVTVLGQTCAALVFVFGGTFIDYVVTLTFLTTIAWTPVVLGLQLQSFQLRSFRHSVLAGVLLAVQASGANPAAGIHQLLLMVGVMLWEATRSWSQLRFAITSTFVITLIGGCLCAPQLFYFLEYVLQSDRWGGVINPQTRHSLPPTYLLQVILPDFWLRQGEFFNEHRLYFGIFPISLMAIASWDRTRIRFFFVVVFFVGLILALGTYGGLWLVLCRLPLFINLHRPFRFLLIASLAAGVLAGVGLDRLVHGESRILRSRRIIFTCYFALTVCLTLATIAAWITQPRFNSGSNTLLNILLTASIFAGLSTVMWCLFNSKLPRNVVGTLALVLITIDLLVCGRLVHVLAPPDYYSKTPSTVTALREDSTQWRALKVYKDVNEEINHPVPGLLTQNMSVLFEIDAWNSNAAAAPLEMSPYLDEVSFRELSLFNVKYLILSNPTSYAGRERNPKLAAERVFDDLDCSLFVNTDFQPRISMRTQYTVIRDIEDVRWFIDSDEFSLRESVTINEDPVFVSGRPLDGQSTRQPIQIIHYGAHRVVFDAIVTQDSILVFSDLFYPGWQATSNRKDVKILRANGLVRGLALGAGHHHIEFTYRPRSFYLGLYVMGTMSFVLLACGVYSIYRRQSL